jgi:Zn-dependent M16 (insulinase) family peptidase
VTCNQADYAVFEKDAPALIDALASKVPKAQKYAFAPPVKNEGLLAASKVQYVNQGANFLDQGFDYTGQLRVLSQILSRVYLTQKIRVQGGAYGAWAMFNRTGFSLFGSYRDPNLQKTLDVFAGLPAYLKGFEASDREMDRFVIGTIARLDKPLTPSSLGQVALSDYLLGLSYSDRQKERDAVLATRQADIVKLSALVKAVLDKSLLCVYGNEKILKDNKKLFEQLVEVIH